MFFVNAAFGQLWRDNEDYNDDHDDDDDDDDTKKRWTVRLILPSGASWSEVLAKPIMWLSISSDKIILTSSLTKPPIITKHIMHKCYLSTDHIHSKDKCDFIPENESIQIQVLKHINEILFSLPFYILENIFFTPNPCSYLGIAYRWRSDNSRFFHYICILYFFAIPYFGKKLPWNSQ